MSGNLPNKSMVGATGFEPATPSPPDLRRALKQLANAGNGGNFALPGINGLERHLATESHP